MVCKKWDIIPHAVPNPFSLGEAEWLVPGVTYGAKVQFVSPSK